MKFRLDRDESGKWFVPKGVTGDKDYCEAIVKYCNTLSPIFERARELDEFNFLLTLWRLRGLSDGGWDPFETTIRGVRDVFNLVQSIDKFELKINLSLWIYCHIIEASEPYEMITNLLHIAHGGHFHPCRYPPKLINGREIPRYPGEKIAVIKSLAKAARFMDLDTMFGEVYNKELRNAVFHSDYANDKKGLRLVSEGKSMPWDDVSQLINRGIAYFDSITNLYEGYIASYTESVVIPAPKGFSPEPDEAIRIIIREGHGAVGFRTEATEEQVACGKIIARGGRYYAEELDMLRKNPDLNVLPKRNK